jgi:dolichol-phosphate mannosyltransferase
MLRASTSVSEAPEGASPAAGLQPAPTLSIVIPTYNERGNIPIVVDRLRASLAGITWELIVVDDDSPDGTASLVKEIGATDSRVRCILRLGRRGLSGACLEGMLASQAEFVAVMDGDLQHDETLLRSMLDLLRRDEANLVVATRYAEGAAAHGLSSRRAWSSRIATGFALRAFDLRLSDPMSGFFMMRRAIVDRVAEQLSTQGFKILLDIAITAHELPNCPIRFGRAITAKASSMRAPRSNILVSFSPRRATISYPCGSSCSASSARPASPCISLYWPRRFTRSA